MQFRQITPATIVYFSRPYRKWTFHIVLLVDISSLMGISIRLPAR